MVNWEFLVGALVIAIAIYFGLTLPWRGSKK